MIPRFPIQPYINLKTDFFMSPKNAKYMLPLQRIMKHFNRLLVLVSLVLVNHQTIAQVIIPRPPEIAATS